jgi:hypothetical protein
VNRAKRSQRAERGRQFILATTEPVCQNCGEKGRHYFPASMGEDGFFTCLPSPPQTIEGEVEG